MDHLTFSRRGGRARSPAKTAANRDKAIAFWKAVRAGEKPSPRRLRTPPAPEIVASLLAEYCRQEGIICLEAFGSTARGDARRGSDVDLMATFTDNPGLRFFTLEEAMTSILGAPVHLVTRESVERMSNPYRRRSILADARVIFHA